MSIVEMHTWFDLTWQRNQSFAFIFLFSRRNTETSMTVSRRSKYFCLIIEWTDYTFRPALFGVNADWKHSLVVHYQRAWQKRETLSDNGEHNCYSKILFVFFFFSFWFIAQACRQARRSLSMVAEHRHRSLFLSVLDKREETVERKENKRKDNSKRHTPHAQGHRMNNAYSCLSSFSSYELQSARCWCVHRGNMASWTSVTWFSSIYTVHSIWQIRR